MLRRAGRRQRARLGVAARAVRFVTARLLKHGPGQQASAWAGLADQLVADTARTCLHLNGCWQRAPDDPQVDAALLLPGVRGLLPADDPRTSATLHAVLAELVQDGHCYRFRQEGRSLADAEGAFLPCGFLMCLALTSTSTSTTAADQPLRSLPLPQERP